MLAPRETSAEVTVGSGPCLHADSIVARVTELLESQNAARTHVRVDTIADTSSSDGLRLAITAHSQRGRTLFRRNYELQRDDCTSVTALVVLAVRRYFRDFPAAALEQVVVERMSPPSRVHSSSTAELDLLAAVNSHWLPVGADVEIGAALAKRFGDRRIGVGFLYRPALRQELGSGSYDMHSALASVMWRSGAPLGVRAELRGGGTYIVGRRFARNYGAWFAAAEGILGLDYVFKTVTVGVQLAISPLDQRLATETMETTRRLPRLRLGLSVAVPVWRKKQ